jgi:hypothetical protein
MHDLQAFGMTGPLGHTMHAVGMVAKLAMKMGQVVERHSFEGILKSCSIMIVT